MSIGAGKKKKVRGRKKLDSSEEEGELENVTPMVRSQRSRKPKKKPVLAFSDSDDSDIELFEVDKTAKKNKGER